LSYSIYVKKVNQELSIKYNRQREFVSLAAHELRSPILPILATLELIEYEFESEEKEITLKSHSLMMLALILVRNSYKMDTHQQKVYYQAAMHTRSTIYIIRI
jgi:signal transduction histidine kinase